MGWLGLKKGVTFGEKHSYIDYGLLMASRPEIAAPEPKRMTVDIPGMDGVLDLTEANVGETKYENRPLTFRFFTLVDIEDSAELKHRIFQDLHGKKLEIILDEDSNYYYYGRCSVSIENETPQKLNVVVTVDAEPFKREIAETEIFCSMESFADAIVPLSHTLVMESPRGSLAKVSLFGVGLARFECGDFSDFDSIGISWSPGAARYGLAIMVLDKAGNQYQQAVTATSDQRATGVLINKSALTGAGVDVSNILSVRVSGATGCKLNGVISYGYSADIENGAESIVPDIVVEQRAITGYFNGKKVNLSVGMNRNPDAYLAAGDNHIVFTTSENHDAYAHIYFRRGWL